MPKQTEMAAAMTERERERYIYLFLLVCFDTKPTHSATDPVSSVAPRRNQPRAIYIYTSSVSNDNNLLPVFLKLHKHKKYCHLSNTRRLLHADPNNLLSSSPFHAAVGRRPCPRVPTFIFFVITYLSATKQYSFY